jgi:hypothetical protein
MNQTAQIRASRSYRGEALSDEVVHRHRRERYVRPPGLTGSRPSQEQSLAFSN